ncbi:MAG TPA: tripartite tricarboxylate transporter substrate binding protein [Burkholderiales bacterium]|nr:tripartite tricarboxylate transporter substrate binding protein [Burkholderiales bacterium]
MNKRHRASLFALAVLACHLPVPAWAQGYPVKPVRYVIPFPAGGSPDLIARLITERFSRMWGQQVLVDNRPGAGGTVGAAFAAKSPPDGYTLFQCNIASSAIAESLYARMPYDQQRDFAPLSRIGTTASVLVVHPSLPARSVKEFIAYAKAHPGKLSYGTSAAGTSPQLSMELLKLSAKIDVVHIAYKGAPQALSDVIGGQIPVSVQTAPGALAAVQAGRVRALAVTSLKRLPQLPDVPTMDESGLPGFEVTSWYGLCAPAGTPVAILDKVHADLTAVLRVPEIQQRLRDIVVEAAPMSREEFAQFIRAEIARWARVIKAAGIPQQ